MYRNFLQMKKLQVLFIFRVLSLYLLGPSHSKHFTEVEIVFHIGGKEEYDEEDSDDVKKHA